MNIKRLIALLMASIILVCTAAAEVQYITDIQISARALDGSFPEPTPQPTPETTAEPAQAISTPAATAAPQPTNEAISSPYEIEVDLNNQIVTVYRAGGRTTGDIARQMICSSGTNGSTPTGIYIMPEIQKEDEREDWYYIGKFRLYVQYASRIVDDILFHSLPSEKKGASPTEDSRLDLGERASHGCIRLRPADSRWIAENCPPGTVVNIFEGGFADDELHALLLKTSFCAEESSYESFLNGEILLSISSELPHVSALQAQLIDLGYDCPMNGLFDAQTHAAVVNWQQDKGLNPTGEVSEDQLAQLLGGPYVAPVATETPTETEDKPASARVKVDTALSLRSQPSSKSEKLDTLPNGTAVEILEESGGWYKVKASGKTGYVGHKYIEIIN